MAIQLEAAMARCSYCGRETELYEGGTPTCVPCSGRATTSKRSIHTRLVKQLSEAATEHHVASASYNQVMSDIPSATPHPDGVQRIHSISRELSVAKKRLARAHCRVADFLDTGAIPEDLLQD